MARKRDYVVVVGLKGLHLDPVAGTAPDWLFGDACVVPAVVEQLVRGVSPEQSLVFNTMLGLRSWRETVDVANVKHAADIHQTRPDSLRNVSSI